MTVLLACHLRGRGAVLAADSRVTSGTEIVTDVCNKTLRCGAVTLAIAGHDGALMSALRPARDLGAVVSAAAAYAKDHENQSWTVVLYDSEGDRLYALDSDGYLQATERLWLAAGCGGTYALGYAEAKPAPKNLAAAELLAREAIRATFKRDSACGGRIRILTCPRA